MVQLTDRLNKVNHFLDNPQPHEKWCMPKGRGGVKKYDKDWRPFTGPLSPTSKATAINSINTLLNYWQKFGYIKVNVLHLIDIQQFQKSKEVGRLKVVERALTGDEWRAMLKVVSLLPVKTLIQRQEQARIKFLLYTLLITALRREEIANLAWNHIGKLRDTWRLEVVGKGGKPALLVLPDNFIKLANNYRALFSYPALDENCDSNENRAVFFSLKTYKRLSGGYINRLIKRVAMQAQSFVVDEAAKKRLGQVSAHWIRHTAATVLDDAGVNKDIIQSHMRHNSSATTDVYIHKNTRVVKDALNSLVEVCD